MRIEVKNHNHACMNWDFFTDIRGAPRQCQNEVLAYELPAAVSRAIQNVLAQSILVVYLYT